MRLHLRVDAPDGMTPEGALQLIRSSLPDDVSASLVAPSQSGNLSGALMDYLRSHAKSGGVRLDVYDGAFLVSIIMQFLEANDAALTGAGVRRFRR